MAEQEIVINTSVLDRLDQQEVFELFLLPKTKKPEGYKFRDALMAETKAKDETSITENKYFYVPSLDWRETSLFLNLITNNYASIVHDAKKYEINIPNIVYYYNLLLESNWKASEKARIERDKKEGKEALISTDFNLYLISALIDKIVELNLEEIDTQTIEP